MVEGRQDHGTCSIENNVYVFCGVGNEGWDLKSIEVSQWDRGMLNAWVTLEMEFSNYMLARGTPSVCPISNEEIVFMGGYC